MLPQTTSTFLAVAGAALALLAFRPQALGQKRTRDLGIAPGILNMGKHNAITDVAGVRVGDATVWEATEEAVYNPLFMARTVTGYAGHTVEAIPVDKVLETCREHKVIRDSR